MHIDPLRLFAEPVVQGALVALAALIAIALVAWLGARKERLALRALEQAVQGAFMAPHSEDLPEAVLRPLSTVFDYGRGVLAVATLDPARLATLQGFSPVRFAEAGLSVKLVSTLAAPREPLFRDELDRRAVREASLRPALAVLDELEAMAAIPLTTDGDVHGVLILPQYGDGGGLGSRFRRALHDAGRRLGPPLAAAEAAMRAALRDAALRQQIAELSEALAEERRRYGLALMPEDAELVSRSGAMAELAAQLGRTAPDDQSVLIIAERGAGADRVARAVHLGSPRRQGPFIQVDAVSLDAEGLDRARRAAQGGSLYVRDIVALDRGLHDSLASSTGDGAIRLVGSSQIDPVAAGPRPDPCLQTVQSPALEPSLWGLLRRGPLRVPALRERREDVGPLATAIIRRHAKAAGKRVEGLTHGALEAVLLYDWPGNVRELDAVLSVAVGRACGALVVRGDLPEWMASQRAE